MENATWQSNVHSHLVSLYHAQTAPSGMQSMRQQAVNPSDADRHGVEEEDSRRNTAQGEALISARARGVVR